MRVWVVIGENYYDGHEIIGVFSNKELADDWSEHVLQVHSGDSPPNRPWDRVYVEEQILDQVCSSYVKGEDRY